MSRPPFHRFLKLLRAPVPAPRTIGQRIGAELRRLRLEAELTQEDVAQLMGSHRPIVCRLERGVHTHTLDEVARYARALDLDAVTVLACLDNLPTEARCAA